MNEYEAEKLGFYFTGSTWDSWNAEEGERRKQEAAEIKKKFKGADYRVVTGTAHSWLGTGNKGIWGNDIFHKVQYWKETNLTIQLNNIDTQIVDLENKIAELKNKKTIYEEADAEIRKLLK